MRASQRGVSLLAALVLVGLLGVAALGISASGNPEAQTAAALITPIVPGVRATPPPADKSKVSLACPKEGQSFIADTATENKQQCVCQKQVSGAIKNYNVTYAVHGDIQKGKFVSVVTARKVEEISAKNASCRLYDCPKGEEDLNKCKILKSIYLQGTDFARANDDLNFVLAKETQRAVEEAPRKIADSMMNNPGASLPPMSQNALDQVNAALEERKRDTSVFSDPNDPLKADAAQKTLQNFAACGQDQCDGIGEDQKGTPADIDNALKDTKKVDADKSADIANLRAQCAAGHCDARDLQTLRAYEKQVEAKDAYGRLKAQCDAGYCDARDLRTLEALKKQAETPPALGENTPCPVGQTKVNSVCTDIKPECTGSLCAGGGGGGGGGGTGGGDGIGKMLPALANLLKGLLQPKPPQAPAQACSTDPNTYAQQQQQYQQQLQQYNLQLQQYNYQQQLSSMYGQSSSVVPPIQPVPCTPSTSQQCQSQPPQPAAESCTAGTWKPTQSGSCITGWQCVPNSGTGGATLSCEPKVADVGMTLAISYSCASGVAVGGGFTATTSPSGTATTTIATPPAGKNTATYTLTCTSGGATTGAQCSVQVAVPSIVLVANPKSVASGEKSIIGWITTGMKSCVVSSPSDSDFTTRNSSNTSVSGTAETSSITSTQDYVLNCQTIGGGARGATTTVTRL